MLKEEDFNRFFNTLKDSSPIYAVNFTGYDEDDLEFRIVFSGYISSDTFIKSMSNSISNVLFSLKRGKALDEFGYDYIKVLKDELYQTIDSFKRITVRNTEFWFQEMSTIYFQEIAAKATKEKKNYYTINTIEEQYFHQIVAFSNARYELCNIFLEGLDKISNDFTSAENKLELKLSVADLALLFRLLDEEKLIQYKYKTDIYRFIANSFKTEKQPNISDASVKNNFLSPDNTSINNIEILLANLKFQLKKI